MTCREYAKKCQFKIVGNLKRMPDHFDFVSGKSYRWYMDEAENEYHLDNPNGKWECFCIVTADGGVL